MYLALGRAFTGIRWCWRGAWLRAWIEGIGNGVEMSDSDSFGSGTEICVMVADSSTLLRRKPKAYGTSGVSSAEGHIQIAHTDEFSIRALLFIERCNMQQQSSYSLLLLHIRFYNEIVLQSA